MDIRQIILDEIKNNPLGFRDLINDKDIQKVFSSIAIITQTFEMHAPSLNSRKTTGFGSTLCHRNGTRHSLVTCRICKKLLKHDKKSCQNL